jgi:hypothetical protein
MEQLLKRMGYVLKKHSFSLIIEERTNGGEYHEEVGKSF